VAFSEGYHPHIKISFGPPLPVGYTSDAEYFDLQLTQPFREEFLEKLRRALPDGITLTGHKHYFASTSSLSKQLNLARYTIPDIDGVIYDSDRIGQIMAAKTMIVKRSRSGIETELDAGRFIDDIIIMQGGLQVDLWQLPDGHIKPEEILVFGLGIDPEFVKQLVIHRASQFHKSGQRLIDPLDLV
jgi:radical SAM-linked protein